MTIDDSNSPADDPPLTASQRLAAAMGRPFPKPLTEEQSREFEARPDRADEEAARIYGPPPPSAP
jgi:hypothetical protein